MILHILIFGVHYGNLHRLVKLKTYFYYLCGIIPFGYWRRRTAREILELTKSSLGHYDFGGNERNLLTCYDNILHETKMGIFKFSALGLYICQSSIAKIFERRLKLIEFVNHHPQIKACHIKNPIFLVGLPHPDMPLICQLLTAIRDVRMLPTWETLSPFPQSHTDNKDSLEFDRIQRKRNFEPYASSFLDPIQLELKSTAVKYECFDFTLEMSCPINVFTLPLMMKSINVINQNDVGDDFLITKLLFQVLDTGKKINLQYFS